MHGGTPDSCRSWLVEHVHTVYDMVAVATQLSGNVIGCLSAYMLDCIKRATQDAGASVTMHATQIITRGAPAWVFTLIFCLSRLPHSSCSAKLKSVNN